MLKKEYLALVKSVIESPGEFNFPLKNDRNISQKARTLYQPLFNFDQVTLVKVEIKTGRKHQIRRHFSRRCQNIIGDTKRGNSQLNQLFREQFGLERIFLHGFRLAIEHPITEKILDVTSPLPDNLCKVLTKLGLSDHDLDHINTGLKTH